MKLIKTLLTSFFPNRCISCGEIIDENEFLCDYCFQMIKRINFEKTCRICGLPKQHCQCKYRVFHFNSSISPFENNDIAKDAMYSFKFKRKQPARDFFINEMSIAVRKAYFDVKFDGVAYVPMTLRKKLKRGFNQAEELAKGIGNIFNLHIYNNLLYCKNNRTKIQHKLKLNERFENVKGLYGFNYNVYGKTILLVDDIKTTGASLDECAKQLLLAGADKVYCVTGLITINRKDKENNGNGYWHRFRLFKNRNIFKF